MSDPRDDEFSIGRLLLDRRFIKLWQLSEGVHHAKKNQMRLGDALVDLKHVDRTAVESLALVQASARARTPHEAAAHTESLVGYANAQIDDARSALAEVLDSIDATIRGLRTRRVTVKT